MELAHRRRIARVVRILCASALFVAATVALAWWAQGGPSASHDRCYAEILNLATLPG